MRMHRDTISFGAFWDMVGNPKLTAGKHLDSVLHKKVPYDVFFTNKDISLGDTNVIKKSKEDLPSWQHTKNLQNTLSSGDTYTKFCSAIPSKVMLELVQIWTSKFLLFKEVKEQFTGEFILWRDCVYETGYGIIFSAKSNKIVIGAYRNDGISCRTFPNNPFGGILSPEQQKEVSSWKTIILAQCIKMPYHRVEEFSQIYVNSLEYVDRNFNIYDEEIVLSRMCSIHPDMFEVISAKI